MFKNSLKWNDEMMKIEEEMKIIAWMVINMNKN